MQSAMNNHDSMFSMCQSWMNSNSNYKSIGNDYKSYNMSSDANNNNMSVVPPSGDRRNPSRPAFANRYAKDGNYSSGMRGSKDGAMYDDGFSGMHNRYDNSSFGDRFGSSSGMYGSGKHNRFDNNSFGDRFGNNSSGMYGSKHGGAMNDDGFSNMHGSKYGGMSNGKSPNTYGPNMKSSDMYGSKFGGAMNDEGFSNMHGSKYGGMSNST